ncbi:MAG: hypothetical protein KGL39_45345 [Patescibacteria group bacterium]|nr:hypothetical protein [Patescibacteria group bacterium]
MPHDDEWIEAELTAEAATDGPLRRTAREGILAMDRRIAYLERILASLRERDDDVDHLILHRQRELATARQLKADYEHQHTARN